MSYCHNCGNKTSQTSKFCSNCGTTTSTTLIDDSKVIQNELENPKKTNKPIYKRFWFWFWVAFEIFIMVTNSPDKKFILIMIPILYFIYNYLFDWLQILYSKVNRTALIVIILILTTFLIVARLILNN